MKKTIEMSIALLAWFAVITQYYLMLENRITDVIETSIRFFSFFTILTNSLVAIFFSYRLITDSKKKKQKANGRLSALTVYILVVGIVYQLVLRPIWDPKGLQKVVDELLHTVIPLLVLLFWYLYEQKHKLTWRLIPSWLIYPCVYLLFILIRGYSGHFYPYPFVNVSELGIQKVLTNSFLLFLFFGFLSLVLIVLGQRLAKLGEQATSP
ncbi:hypothetical protein CLV98_101783 [Dyadobacter jejuensis]|uniref:FAR-17a/AIG1-like protein n=1 Tax=Dyadobacter jejuensis TaxID=1082580 RepID=A0A316ASV0_9BACT|nr:Pr6Pr family membrane protein [Dyadobacter jejuensis]PWJ60598.1 hypothetical protein CLV98_101783 [Dyadobacter jejuensis]